MNRQDYLAMKQAEQKKVELKKQRAAAIAEKLGIIMLHLKMRYYTSPKDYGRCLANMPRHKHAKGKRILHTTNF